VEKILLSRVGSESERNVLARLLNE
jgi:hypothetical protein